jgi:PAS domain S-box-containing protein
VLIAYIDDQQLLRFSNRAYEHWFGIGHDEILNRHLRDVFGAPSYQRMQSHVATVLAGKETSFESSVLIKDGKTRHVMANFIPDFDADGRAKGFYAVVTDITERKRHEEEMIKLNAELEDRVRPPHGRTRSGEQGTRSVLLFGVPRFACAAAKHGWLQSGAARTPQR